MTVALSLAACKTTETADVPEPQEPAVQLSQLVEFIPADSISQIQFLEGRHESMYTPTSSAVWVNDSVAQLKRKKDTDAGLVITPALDQNAMLISESFVVIECTLESQFSDMTVAYDAVGLRNAQVYLLLPDGAKVTAIQRIPRVPVEEEQAGALKRFRRTNILIFPKRDFTDRNALISADLEAAKLVIDRLGTKFYFEWDSALPNADGQRKTTVGDVVKAVRTGFTEFYGAVQPVLHTFD